MIALSRWKIIAVAFAVLFGILFTLPNLVPAGSLPAFLPHARLNLGLDLRGGSQLLLQADLAAFRAQRLTKLTEDTRETLSQAQIVFVGPITANGRVTVQITDLTKVDAAAAALRRRVAATGMSGRRTVNLAVRDAGRIELSLDEGALQADANQAVEQSLQIVRRRIDPQGNREPTIQRQGAARILVQVPGESDPNRLERLIGQTAQLTFQMVDDTVTPEELAAGRAPPGSEILPSDEGRPEVVRRRVLVSGEMLNRAGQGFDSQNGQPVVNFEFNGEGQRRFAEVTTHNIGKRFAIILDGRVISAPVIQSAITQGTGQISGHFTAESALNLATLLNAGALPVPLRVESKQSVGPGLGADAIRAGATSLAIGAALIFAFIILAYGAFGLYAAIALVVNILMMIGVLSLTQGTLTLPGIAGIILTLAVAVDANVLIYERIRDEARTGRTPIAAVETGYQRALVSIFDANITTLISAIIMLWLGAGPVRGFALTLIIGVITSVFTAVVITQLCIGIWFRFARPKSLPIA
jgi:preprotein translocase subunit SecD